MSKHNILVHRVKCVDSDLYPFSEGTPFKLTSMSGREAA